MVHRRAVAAADLGPLVCPGAIIGIPPEALLKYFVLLVSLLLDPAAVLLLLTASARRSAQSRELTALGLRAHLEPLIDAKVNDRVEAYAKVFGQPVGNSRLYVMSKFAGRGEIKPRVDELWPLMLVTANRTDMARRFVRASLSTGQ